MSVVTVESRTADFERFIQSTTNNFPHVVGAALRLTANDAKDNILDDIPNYMENPTRFTRMKSGVRVHYQRFTGTQTKVWAKVFVMPAQAKYMHWLTDGGTQTKSLSNKSDRPIDPINTKMTAHGNIAGLRGGKVFKHKDRFITERNGVLSLYERAKRRKRAAHMKGKKRKQPRDESLKLLVSFRSRRMYAESFPFYDIARYTYNTKFPRIFNRLMIGRLTPRRR